jgi:hypothetical protein
MPRFSLEVAGAGLARPGGLGQGTSDLRVMRPNAGEGVSNRISSRLRVPPVVQYPRAQRGWSVGVAQKVPLLGRVCQRTEIDRMIKPASWSLNRRS